MTRFSPETNPGLTQEEINKMASRAKKRAAGEEPTPEPQPAPPPDDGGGSVAILSKPITEGEIIAPELARRARGNAVLARNQKKARERARREQKAQGKLRFC